MLSLVNTVLAQVKSHFWVKSHPTPYFGKIPEIHLDPN